MLSKLFVWDVICVDALAPSHIFMSHSSSSEGVAAYPADQQKQFCVCDVIVNKLTP